MGDRLRAVPAWAWLAAIVIVSFALRALLARSIVAPFILVDELVYSSSRRASPTAASGWCAACPRRATASCTRP